MELSTVVVPTQGAPSGHGTRWVFQPQQVECECVN
jgi:hypothetical protein